MKVPIGSNWKCQKDEPSKTSKANQQKTPSAQSCKIKSKRGTVKVSSDFSLQSVWTQGETNPFEWRYLSMQNVTPQPFPIPQRIAEIRKIRFQITQLTHRIPARNAEALTFARMLVMIADRAVEELEADLPTV